MIGFSETYNYYCWNALSYDIQVMYTGNDEEGGHIVTTKQQTFQCLAKVTIIWKKMSEISRLN